VVNPVNFGAAVNQNIWRAQTFTPSVSGLLTTIELQIGHGTGGNPTDDLTIELVQLDTNGLPDQGNVLATRVLNESDVPDNSFPVTFTSIDFSADGINLTAGQQLGIVASSLTGSTPNWYVWSTSRTDDYAGGSTAFRAPITGSWDFPTTSVDSGFRVFVSDGTSIPEPSSALLIGLMLGGFVAFRRFRK